MTTFELVPRAVAAPYFGVALLNGALATVVLFGGRGAMRRPLLALLLGISGVLIAFGTAYLAADPATASICLRATGTMMALIPPLSIDFALAAVAHKNTTLRVAAWSSGVLVALVTAATPWVLAGAHLGSFAFVGRPGPLFTVAVSILSLNFVASWLLARGWQRERRQGAREQLALLLLASVVANFGVIDVLPSLDIDLPPAGWLPLALSSLALLFAFVRHRLVEVRLALFPITLWVLFTVIGALPFVLPLLVFHAWLADAARLPLAAISLAMALAMRVYLANVQPRVDELVGRRRRNLDAELTALRGACMRTQEVEEVGQALDRFLQIVARRLAALVFVDSDGEPRVVFSAWGAVPAPPRNSILLQELAHVRGLLGRDQVRGPRRLELERAFVRWGAEFMTPLLDGDRLIGLAAISARAVGDKSDEVELAAMARASVVATGALVNVDLFERLRALSVELEEKAAARNAELARTLRDLRGAQTRLIESERLVSLGEIVGGIAGDLRQQVERVSSEAARLKVDVAAVTARLASVPTELADAALAEACRDLVPIADDIGEGARRARTIADDLAHIAPRDAGGEVALEATALNELVETTLHLMARQLGGLEIVRELSPDLPPAAAQPGPLGQVIVNLLINSVQATRGHGRIVVSTRVHDDWIELQVGDNGPGIAPELLPRIFEPFFSTKAPGTGTGLGLSVSYNIISRCGGDITISSDVGEGTTVRVRLRAHNVTVAS